MMAQPSHDAHVIGPQFVVPYQINVVVNRCPTGYLEITEIQNNIMFTIRSCNTPLHGPLSAVDARWAWNTNCSASGEEPDCP
ncbi:hypothetical protein Hanom_Chr04g00314801 [Helianthus anomalus]